MENQFNNLSPAESERLFLLAEELGETIQAIGKILRHGYESYHPDGGLSNRRQLEKEIGDVIFAIDMLINGDDVNSNIIELQAMIKKNSVEKYLHHQSSPNDLDFSEPTIDPPCEIGCECANCYVAQMSKAIDSH